MTDEVEEWRGIKDFPRYQVSNMGRVRSNYGRGSGSHKIRDWKILKPFVSSSGYNNILLSPGRRHFDIHRLVLSAFVGPCPEGCEALHGNDIRTDNRLSNLKWGTRSENHCQIVLNGHHNKTKLNSTQVRIIRRCYALKISPAFLGSLFGVCRQTITSVAAGRTWGFYE